MYNKIDVSNSFSKTVELIKENKGTILKLMGVSVVVYLTLMTYIIIKSTNAISSFTRSSYYNNYEALGQFYSFMIIASAASCIIIFVIINAGKCLYHNEKFSFKVALKLAFRKLFSVIFLVVLLILPMIICVALLGAVVNFAGLLSIIILPLISIIISVFFMFVNHSLVVNDLSAIDALKESFAIAKVNFSQLMLVQIAFLVLSFVTNIIVPFIITQSIILTILVNLFIAIGIIFSILFTTIMFITASETVLD